MSKPRPDFPYPCDRCGTEMVNIASKPDSNVNPRCPNCGYHPSRVFLPGKVDGEEVRT